MENTILDRVHNFVYNHQDLVNLLVAWLNVPDDGKALTAFQRFRNNYFIKHNELELIYIQMFCTIMLKGIFSNIKDPEFTKIVGIVAYEIVSKFEKNEDISYLEIQKLVYNLNPSLQPKVLDPVIATTHISTRLLSEAFLRWLLYMSRIKK